MRWWRVLATVVATGLLVVMSALPAAAVEGSRHEYLALGDSVAFGTRPAESSPPINPFVASNFAGYPEVLAPLEGLALTNASCPGETSNHFISLTGLDNVCGDYRRASLPLHVAYNTAQLDFAIAYLRDHPDTELVTIDIGANDVFVLQRDCAQEFTCVLEGLPRVLNRLSTNLTQIYGRLRGEGHYRNTMVALTYYARDYADPFDVSATLAINSAIERASRGHDVLLADGFAAFRAAAVAAGGSSCAAGLLYVLPSGAACDIHPSPEGQRLLAGAIRAVLPAAVDQTLEVAG
jgi:lysophospholipase L1-like esterase